MLYFNTNVGATLLRSFFHSSRWFGGVFQYQSEAPPDFCTKVKTYYK